MGGLGCLIYVGALALTVGGESLAFNEFILRGGGGQAFLLVQILPATAAGIAIRKRQWLLLLGIATPFLLFGLCLGAIILN